jgi:TRAP-type C4-dicarboxylate transport system substrate-binding protein
MKTKRILLRGLVVGFVLIMMISALVGCSASNTPTSISTQSSSTTSQQATSQANQVYKLRYQTVIPASGIAKTKHFTDIVKQMSGGRIEISAYMSDQLVPSMELLNAVQSKTIDMAETVSGMHSQITSGPLLSGLPYSTFSDAETMAMFERFKDGRLMQIEREEFASNGAYFLGPVYSGSLTILTKNPITKIDDLSGLKIMALDPTSSDFLTNIGVAAEFVPPEEIYTALQNKTVDGCLYAGPAIYVEQGLNEVATNVTTPYPIYSGPMSLIINKEVWNSLPSDLQAILIGATDAHCKWMVAQIYLEDQQALSSGKIKANVMSNELLNHMKTASLKTWEGPGSASAQSKEALSLIKEWQTLQGR